jgi:hypothetical protein
MKRGNERLIAWVLLGILALNYPLLSLFSKPVLWFGIPALYLYLFVFWVLFIAVVAGVTGMQESAGTESIPRGSREKDRHA